jgi:hypothetical protein
MSIVVFASYTYWNDGHCSFDGPLEFDSERSAILELGYIAYFNADMCDVQITRVIDGESGAIDRIQQGVNDYVAEKKREQEIRSHKQTIKDAQTFLDTFESRAVKYKQQIEESTARLKELGVDNES